MHRYRLQNLTILACETMKSYSPELETSEPSKPYSADDARLELFELPCFSVDFSEGGGDSVKDGAWLSEEAALEATV